MVRDPSFFTAVAAVPVTSTALGVASLVFLIRYECPAWALIDSVAAVDAPPTGWLVAESTIDTDVVPQGLRTFTVPGAAASSTANATAPFTICTSTFDLPWTWTVPEALQPLGQAGATRTNPSNPWTSASLMAVAKTPSCSR